MTRAELLTAIDDAFENYADQVEETGTGSVEMIRSKVREAIVDYCDGLDQTLSEANQLLDDLIGERRVVTR